MNLALENEAFNSFFLLSFPLVFAKHVLGDKLKMVLVLWCSSKELSKLSKVFQIYCHISIGFISQHTLHLPSLLPTSRDNLTIQMRSHGRKQTAKFLPNCQQPHIQRSSVWTLRDGATVGGWRYMKVRDRFCPWWRETSGCLLPCATAVAGPVPPFQTASYQKPAISPLSIPQCRSHGCKQSEPKWRGGRRICLLLWNITNRFKCESALGAGRFGGCCCLLQWVKWNLWIFMPDRKSQS